MVSSLKKSKNLLFVYFLLILTLLLGCFIVEGHSYFDGGRQSDMTNIEMFISVGGYLLLLASLCLVLPKAMLKPKWQPLAFFGVGLLVDILAIYFFPGVYDTGELIYQIDGVTEFRYCAYALVIFSLLYLLFAVVPELTANTPIYDLVLFVAVVIVLTAVVFSYFTEADLYLAIIRNGGPDDGLVIPTSWTAHKNVYSFVLFNGLAAEAILEAKCPHGWRWPIILFLYCNQFFLVSKTGLAAASFFVVGFYLWHFVKTLPQHKLRNWITLGVVLGGLLVFLLVGFLSPEALWLNHFFRITWDFMISSLSTTLMDRIYVWSDVVRCIISFPLTLMIGVGYGNWAHVFYAYLLGDPNGYYPMDSAWVADLARAGIFGVLFSAALDLYVLYLLIDAIKHHSKIGVVSSLYAVCLFFRSFVEAGDIANPDSFGMIYMGLLVLPLLAERYSRLHPALRQDREGIILNSEPASLPRQPFTAARFIPKFLSFSSALFVMATFAVLAAGILNNNSLVTSADFFYAFTGIALFFPYVILGLVFLMKSRHLYGFITLLFWSLVTLFMTFFLPSLGTGWLGVLFPVMMGFILLLVVLFSGIFPTDKSFIRYSLIYSGLAIVLLFGGRWIIEVNPVSSYLTLCLMGFSLLCYLFVSCLPFASSENWFLDKWSDRFIRYGDCYAVQADETCWRVYHGGRNS